LWTNRLPPNIQAIIVTQGQAALDDVAQLADKIAEVTPSPWVASVSSSSADICTLTARIDELTQQVAALAESWLSK
jgi:acetaldehyde dehydrogenase (acetylating)